MANRAAFAGFAQGLTRGVGMGLQARGQKQQQQFQELQFDIKLFFSSASKIGNVPPEIAEQKVDALLRNTNIPESYYTQLKQTVMDLHYMGLVLEIKDID